MKMAVTHTHAHLYRLKNLYGRTQKRRKNETATVHLNVLILWIIPRYMIVDNLSPLNQDYIMQEMNTLDSLIAVNLSYLAVAWT
jgi:hypothetical protein